EKDVVAFCARLADRRRKICAVSIVDHGLVTVASLSQRNLFGRTGEPDRAATRDMRELPDKTSDAAGRGRDQNVLARLRVAKSVKGEVGGEPIDAEQAQIGAE